MTPALATIHTGSGHAQHKIRGPWADFQPFSNNSHPEDPQVFRLPPPSSQEFPHPRTAPMGVLCHQTVWPGPLPSPRHSTVTQAPPPPCCGPNPETCTPTLHPRILTYLWFPDPTPGLSRCYTSQDLKAPVSPFHRKWTYFTARTPRPQPRAHLPQQPRGIHTQPAAPLHRVHSPICASPLAQDFTPQENRDERAGGEALLIGLWTERQ